MQFRFQTHGEIAAAWLLVGAATTVWGQAPASVTATKPAQDYPSKPIRLIDPFPPGGGTWIVAHLIAQELLERWGVPLVVDNRGGAGGAIGSELAARAVPDGYTLVMATASTIAINPLVSKTPFDPVRDFDAVAHTTIIPLILVVHPLVAAKSVKELIALARSRPGKLDFASSGSGTISHLAGELFKITAGVDMVHVPYKGGGPALIDLVGGQVQLNFANMLSALPYVKAGRLRGLAVTSPRRAPAIRDIPTVAEAGVAGYDVVQWNGVLAPAGTPAQIVIKLNREIGSILSLPDVRERLLNDGAETVVGSPQHFAAFITADIAKWANVIKTQNIRSER